MTREEIIRNLKYTMEKHKNDNVNTFDTNISVMCKDILDYLDQEPCEDAISRQAVLDCLTATGLKKYDYILNARYKIKNLPSVKPQEPKTVLYSGDGYADGYMVYDMAECPNCGYEYEDGDKDWGLSYCPNCGQKLNWERSE